MAYGEKRVLQPAPGIEREVEQERPALKQPWVSYGIIGASVIVFLLDFQARGQLQNAFALYGPAVWQGQWYRVLSTVVTHAGFLHIFFNMSVVWTLGFGLERAIASWRFLLVSLVTALGAGAFVLWLAPNLPTVGASGMILGWAGAMLPIATSQGRRTIGFWLIQIALISLLPFVSWQGHLGGFLFGLPCGVLLRNRAKYFGMGMPVLIAVSAFLVYWAGTHPMVVTR